MSWFKRFSNGVLALIIVGIITVLAFALILPIGIRISKYGKVAANGWTAATKNPPEVVYEQLSKDTELYGVQYLAGDIVATVKCKRNYKELKITFALYEEGTDNIITHFIDINGVSTQVFETNVVVQKDVKKGTLVVGFRPQQQTLDNYDVYEIACNVTYYK